MVIVAYLKAIWHYWNHCNAKGLADNSEYLRKVCEVDKAHWESTCAILFDNDKFFTLGEDGMWHQTRAAREWSTALERYQIACAKGKAGALKRWGKRPPRRKSK